VVAAPGDPSFPGEAELPAVTAPLPLRGIRVLDLSTFLSGPLVTRSLADLGAEIIKVEPPTGDPTRAGMTMGGGQPPSPFWVALHRDRKSVVLDLKGAAGRSVFLDLVAAADVVVENFRPGVMDRLQLGVDRLRAVNGQLVHCSITGFGSDGPIADQVAIDGPVQAFAGLVDLSAVVGLARSPVPITVADIAGASSAAQAVLAALFARERGAPGCHIDISLFEALVQWLSVSDRSGTLAPPVTQVLEGCDGKPLLVQTPLHFQARLVELIGTVAGFETFASDPRFATKEGIRQHAEEYTSTLRRAFATRSRDEWLALLGAAGIPAAPVNSLDEAMRHPQLEHREAVVDLAVPGAGDALVVLSPYRFDGARRVDTALPPALGEHTALVLQTALGYDRSRLEALAAEGAFGALTIV
jgi:crotonobetainyl-CoA:carnitine CoA-transferase CaiB-like acyl-CoA transferase